jgi:hypothetical protein
MEINGWQKLKERPVLVATGNLSSGVREVFNGVNNLSKKILGRAAGFLNGVQRVVFIPCEVKLIQDLQNLALLDPTHRKALEFLEKECFEIGVSDTGKIFALEKYIETLGETLKKLEERPSQGLEKTIEKLRSFLETTLYHYIDTLKGVSLKKRGEVLFLLKEVIKPHVVVTSYEVKLIQDLQNLALLDPKHQKALKALEECFQEGGSDAGKIAVLEEYLKTLGETLENIKEESHQKYEEIIEKLRSFLETTLYDYMETLKGASFTKKEEILSFLTEVIKPEV